MAQGHAIEAADVSEAQVGWALAHQVRDQAGKRLFRKGSIITAADVPEWSRAEAGTVHLLEPGPGDLHEDEAGRRLADLVNGGGMDLRGPVQSRFNLVSNRKGLLRVDADLLRRVNAVDGLTAFTLLDRQPVTPGKVVCGIKVTPIFIAGSQLDEVARIVREVGHAPVVVEPFIPRKVAIFSAEQLPTKQRERFTAAVEKKLNWYGAEITEIRWIAPGSQSVAATISELAETGIDLVLAAGGNTIDPLDQLFEGLIDAGAEMLHFGAPTHPGSMFWLARFGELPVINLASCSMYSKATIADLILPLVMTGREVSSADVIEIGYGGLLDRDMMFRFPDYDADEAIEPELIEE